MLADVEYSELATIKEVNSDPHFYIGKKVRIIGRLKAYSYDTGVAEIFEDSEKLFIDFNTFKEAFQSDQDYFYEFFGVIEEEASKQLILILKVTLQRKLEHYHKALGQQHRDLLRKIREVHVQAKMRD